jgi:hypothetical protein
MKPRTTCDPINMWTASNVEVRYRNVLDIFGVQKKTKSKLPKLHPYTLNVSTHRMSVDHHAGAHWDALLWYTKNNAYRH